MGLRNKSPKVAFAQHLLHSRGLFAKDIISVTRNDELVRIRYLTYTGRVVSEFFTEEQVAGHLTFQ